MQTIFTFLRPALMAVAGLAFIVPVLISSLLGARFAAGAGYGGFMIGLIVVLWFMKPQGDGLNPGAK